jgi:hypothetical protein
MPLDELKTETLSSVPIFKAGTWTDSGGRTKRYTANDIEQMVRNFKALLDRVKPHLKLMHLRPEDHRRITAAPALGWITSLRRDGMTLVADFAKVPQKVAQLIRAGTYRRVSAEIFHRWKDETSGKVYQNVVSAVGLLGAVHPAVNTLDDVMKLFGMEAGDAVEIDPVETAEWAECYGDAEPVAVGFYEANHSDSGNVDKSKPKQLEGGDGMDEKEVQALIDKATKPLKDSAAKFQSGVRAALGIEKDGDIVAEIVTLKNQNAANEQRLAESAEAKFEADVEAVILDAKKAGKLAPAQEHGIKVMVSAWREQTDDAGMFSLKVSDEKTVKGDVVECLKGYFEAAPKQFNIEDEQGDKDVKTPKGPLVPADVAQHAISDPGLRGEYGPRYCSVDLDKEIRAYMKEYKVDYIEAMEEVTGVERPVEPDLSMHSLRDIEEV